MVGAIGEHAFAGGRFPPEAGGSVERQDRAGLVDAHAQVADADAAEVIGQAPAGAVDVVLHGGADGDAELVLQSRATGGPARPAQFSVAISDMFRSSPQISMRPSATRCLSRAICFGGPALEVFAHGPGGLAGPAEPGVVRVAVGQVAVIQGVVDVAQVLGQNLRLRPGVADVGVGVLGEVHCPLPRRLRGERAELLLSPAGFDAHSDGCRRVNGGTWNSTGCAPGGKAGIVWSLGSGQAAEDSRTVTSARPPESRVTIRMLRSPSPVFGANGEVASFTDEIRGGAAAGSSAPGV